MADPLEGPVACKHVPSLSPRSSREDRNLELCKRPIYSVAHWATDFVQGNDAGRGQPVSTESDATRKAKGQTRKAGDVPCMPRPRTPQPEFPRRDGFLDHHRREGTRGGADAQEPSDAPWPEFAHSVSRIGGLREQTSPADRIVRCK